MTRPTRPSRPVDLTLKRIDTALAALDALYALDGDVLGAEDEYEIRRLRDTLHDLRNELS